MILISKRIHRKLFLVCLVYNNKKKTNKKESSPVRQIVSPVAVDCADRAHSNRVDHIACIAVIPMLVDEFLLKQ